VVLYTDGVVEAMNEERDEWGDEALDEFTLKHATVPSKEYVRLLLKALDDHKGDAEQHDDITVTTFRIT
jgi:serine phosphatase RsbU (regulator of sigma subunit)